MHAHWACTVSEGFKATRALPRSRMQRPGSCATRATGNVPRTAHVADINACAKRRLRETKRLQRMETAVVIPSYQKNQINKNQISTMPVFNVTKSLTHRQQLLCPVRAQMCNSLAPAHRPSFIVAQSNSRVYFDDALIRLMRRHQAHTTT